ncbi:MAG: DUF885 domain-containing protein [Gemmatimonadaceae bacterium]
MSALAGFARLTMLAVATPLLHAQDSTVASRALSRVLDDINRHRLEQSISLRMQHGLPIERLPDLSVAQWHGDVAFWRGVSTRLAPLGESQLNMEERLSLRSIKWEAKLSVERAPFYWLDFGLITPYATPLQDVERVFRSHPLQSTEDLDRFLRLLRNVPAFVDSMRAGLEARAARGLYLARDEIPQSEQLLRTFIADPVNSPFGVDASRLAPALTGRVNETFTRELSTEITQRINPAFERLTSYLTGAYRERAPNRVGLGQYPGGKDYHRWLVRWHSTMEVSPDAVHRIGLAEVDRINREMAAIRRELGFTGTKAAFRAALASDPRFFARTPEEIGERLMSYARRIEPRLPEFFARIPRAKGDARRLAPNLEPAMTFGYYQVPTATDSMGHYYYNGSSLAERSLLTAGPLIAHELWPGHHFQSALARENTSLSPYRREAYYTAYGEGWGEYASIVAGEMGMYADAYDRYGRLAMDMFISCRLVVDTGMNFLGWSRERAMAFMRDNLLESDTQIRSESLRYSVDLPGQALAYKMGSREFVRLRAHAQRALGSRFDIRQFHDVVLSSGMLPLGVLGAKVDWWITAQRSGQRSSRGGSPVP